jgi:hypothetical protein
VGRIDEARAALKAGLGSAVEQGVTYEQGLLMVLDVELDDLTGISTPQQTLDEIETLFRGLGVNRSQVSLLQGLDGDVSGQATLLPR